MTPDCGAGLGIIVGGVVCCARHARIFEQVGTVQDDIADREGGEAATDAT